QTQTTRIALGEAAGCSDQAAVDSIREQTTSGVDADISGAEGGTAALPRERDAQATKTTASWSDEDVEELFRLRYKGLVNRFKNTRDTKRIKYAWALLASTLSVNQGKVFTDQQCQAKMKNMKSKWASAREAEGRTGNGGPVRPPKHYTIMKDYWGDATGMNNRPYLSTEDSDIILTVCEAASGDASMTSDSASSERHERCTLSEACSASSSKRVKRVRTQGECVEAGLSAVAKGFSEGLEAIGKGLASVRNEGSESLTVMVQKRTELLREQSERAHAQNEQLLKQLQAQSEQLSIQNGHISALLNLLQRSR
ncbi:Myb/SANT-like DNA-binding domain, partial [Phytophthora infestans]